MFYAVSAGVVSRLINTEKPGKSYRIRLNDTRGKGKRSEPTDLDTARYNNIVLGGVPGRYYAPKTLEKEVLKSIQVPALLILGKRDSLAGDTKKRRNTPRIYRN